MFFWNMDGNVRIQALASCTTLAQKLGNLLGVGREEGTMRYGDYIGIILPYSY